MIFDPTDRSDQTDPADRVDPTDRTDRTKKLSRLKTLRPGGGYRKLRSFRVATVIYDATVSFCDRFVDKRSRTHDQMVQAGRSGRQNIAEGSRASATSSQTELRLVGVARASLDELLLDFEDFLRQRGLAQWGKDDPRAKEVRAIRMTDPSDRTDQSDPTDRSDFQLYGRWLNHRDPEIVANAIICLIHQANYLLDRQIAGLERQFIRGGGYSERLAAARIEERRGKRSFDRTDQSDPTDRTTGTDLTDPSDRSDQTERPEPRPTCPLCGKPMTLRTARKGAHAGSLFWGCTGYPDCKGTQRSGKADRPA
jgi:four helix bundle suffix protein